MFSRNIRYYRLMNRMSMNELAEQARISANAIKKYEHGEMMPSSETLEALASALQVNPLQLMQIWNTDAPVQPLHHRRRAQRTAREEEAVQCAVEMALGRYMTILSMLPASYLPMPAPIDKRTVESDEQVEEAATHVRTALGVSATGPMPDLVGMLENRGYLVVMVPDAPDWFDAQFGTVGDRPYIALADGRPPDRQRHTVAHEMGHLWLDVRQLNEEKTAGRFAGALLLPRADMLRELYRRRRNGIALEELRLIQNEYGVSMKSVVMRARQLGIINEAAESVLYARLGAQGLSRDERAGFARETPTVYRQMVIQLTMDQEISLSRGAELLGVDLLSMRNLLFGEDPAS